MWIKSVLVANLKVTCNLMSTFHHFTNLQLRFVHKIYLTCNLQLSQYPLVCVPISLVSLFTLVGSQLILSPFAIYCRP